VVTVPDVHGDRQVRTLRGAWRGIQAVAAIGWCLAACLHQPAATLLRARLSSPGLWGYSKHLRGFA
jgi:hypothetical protein